MKKPIQALVVVLFITSGFCMGSQVYTYNEASGWYETAEDYSIVNTIKAKSDLSQADVDKFKLLSLGGFQNVAAAGLGSYAMYKAGQGTYGGLDMLGEYGPSSDNKFLWALAGAAGVGFGAYKVLYPRLKAGVLGQVKTFIDMCENLDIYNFAYRTPGELAYLGTSGVNNQQIPYNPAWRTTNAAWAKNNNIARIKALDNLLNQYSVAIELLAQLERVESSQETQDLSKKATGIGLLLDRGSINYQMIMAFAQAEAQERARKVAAHQLVVRQGIQLDQSKANVEVAKQQASALWYGKIMLAGTGFSNFVKNSLQTVVYVNDNKEKIVGGLLIGSAAVYGSLIWLQSKLMGR